MLWVLIGSALVVWVLAGAFQPKRRRAKTRPAAAGKSTPRPLWIAKRAFEQPSRGGADLVFKSIFKNLNRRYRIEYIDTEARRSLRWIRVNDGRGPWMGELLYLDAWCEKAQAERTFRVDGIMKIKRSGENWSPLFPETVIVEDVCDMADLQVPDWVQQRERGVA